MDEVNTLTRIQTAFKPYTKSPEQLQSIRIQLAKYIASLDPRSEKGLARTKSDSIPPHVTGIRYQYLLALHANIKARQVYDQLRSETQIRTSPSAVAVTLTSSDAIQSHLTLLALRRRYQELQILRHYLSRLGQVSSQSQLFDAPPALRSSVTDLPERSSTDVAPLTLQARELTRDLELAVLRANYHLKRERQLLEDLKKEDDLFSTPSSEAKARALIATNQELTRWIEESLEKCDPIDSDAVNHAQHQHTLGHGHELEELSARVYERYERYLEARKSLLDAAASLASSQDDQAKHHKETKRPTPATTKQARPVHKEPASPVPCLDAQHLMLQHHQVNLQQAQSHMSSSVAKHNQDLFEQLLRLSDESHLLPSYPILAKLKPSTQGDAVMGLVNAWKFAMEAAGTATEATAQKQMKLGEEAIKRTLTLLQDVGKERQLWDTITAIERKQD